MKELCQWQIKDRMMQPWDVQYTTFTPTVLRSLMNTEACLASKNSSNVHNVCCMVLIQNHWLRHVLRLRIFTLNTYKSCHMSGSRTGVQKPGCCIRSTEFMTNMRETCGDICLFYSLGYFRTFSVSPFKFRVWQHITEVVDGDGSPVLSTYLHRRMKSLQIESRQTQRDWSKDPKFSSCMQWNLLRLVFKDNFRIFQPRSYFPIL